jgi:periplasmic copper chaperone A
LIRKSTAVVLAAGVAVLALPALASAHVTVQPQEAPAKGFVVESVRVPNEETSANTTRVAVQFPPGFSEVSYEPVPGWKVAVKKTKLAKPITTDEGNKLTEEVSQMVFSGGRIAPGQFQDFPLSMQMPDKPQTTLTFKAIQTYDNGKVVRWIGPPSAAEPAPQVKVTSAAAETASAAPASSGSSGKEDSDSKTLSIVALIVGALGLLAGGAALLARRRAA